MKRKALWRCSLAGMILAAFWTAAEVWGMAGKDHFALWNQIFGIADPQSKESIEPLWEAAQRVIDSSKLDSTSSTTDYRRLKNQFPWFSWGSHGHRLLFHWGFNGNPREHPPLRDRVRDLLKKKKREDPNFNDRDEEDKFFRALINIQKERNKYLICAVQSTLGIPTARGYANALATIIYDVHLLGDYETPLTSGLPRLDTIEADLIEKGFKRLLTGGDRMERLRKIDDDLKTAIRTGRGRINRIRAGLLLEAARRYLPGILNERFQHTLKEKGIRITLPPAL